MFKDPQELLRLLLPISTFALVLSVWVGGVLFWSARRIGRTRQMRQRLGLEAPVIEDRVLHLWHEGKEVTTTVAAARLNLGIRRRLERAFDSAGWVMSGNQILALFSGAMLVSTLFAWYLSGHLFMGVGFALALLIVARIVILGRIAKRTALFDHQLVDSLELAARSLRAGHPLLGAFHLLSEEMPPPIRDVFGDICQQQSLGADLESLLRAKGQESSSTDLKLFATAVAIQMRAGGNLANLMDRLASVIRQRIRGQRRFRALTAQTQLSKRILLALPFIMFVVLTLINPTYMEPFFEVRQAQILLGVALGLLAMGAWIMNKMVQIKF